jgi:hypothetical protein
MARLKEDLALSRTYAEGLMVQIGGMDREREMDMAPVAGDLRRALAVQQNEVKREYHTACLIATIVTASSVSFNALSTVF